MTTVHISLGRDDGTDQTAAKGVLEWEPTTRREDGTMVILERGFVKPLVDGEATVIVDPSGLTWCWRVTERTDSGGTVRYVSVPDSAAVVEYVDLPDVDPTTLQPWSPADPEAAYQTALDNLDLAPVATTGTFASLTDVDTTDLADGVTVVWDATTSTWKVAESGVAALADLSDVDLTGLADGDAMVWDQASGKWVRVSLSSTYVAQADLTVTTGASVSGSNTGDQDLSGLLTTAAATELIRDTMASALVAGANVTITPDDGADTITIAATGGGSDPWTYAIVTSATTTTSTTPANINGLAVPALADGLWEVEGIALGYGASATEGAMVGLGAAPSGATVYSFAFGPITVTGTFTSHFPDANAAASLANSGGSGTRILARFGAVIRASTMADAWPLTIRSETAGQTSVVVADSFLRYRKIAD